MYRRIALTIALALSVITLSLVSSDSTARAQKTSRYTTDTGVVTLGPDQILRITVALGDTGTHGATVRFRSMEYTQGTCNGGVCKHPVAFGADILFPSATLSPGEAASIDIANNSFGVRGIVLSNSKDVRVNALIIDTATGKVVSNNAIECSFFEHG